MNFLLKSRSNSKFCWHQRKAVQILTSGESWSKNVFLMKTMPNNLTFLFEFYILSENVLKLGKFLVKIDILILLASRDKQGINPGIRERQNWSGSRDPGNGKSRDRNSRNFVKKSDLIFPLSKNDTA